MLIRGRDRLCCSISNLQKQASILTNTQCSCAVHCSQQGGRHASPDVLHRHATIRLLVHAAALHKQGCHGCMRTRPAACLCLLCLRCILCLLCLHDLHPAAQQVFPDSPADLFLFSANNSGTA
jgi:hypothetical protein